MERMNQPNRRVLICHLVDEMRRNKSWAGHTHIQKCMLFLQKLFYVPTGYEFVLYLHGPFSFELRDELALMRARHNLAVEANIKYGPSFILTHRGKLATESCTEYKGAIEFVAKELSWNDVRLLERLSTVFFLQEADPHQQDDKTAVEVHRLKPHISKEHARSAVIQVNELRQKVADLKLCHQPTPS